VTTYYGPAYRTGSYTYYPGLAGNVPPPYSYSTYTYPVYSYFYGPAYRSYWYGGPYSYGPAYRSSWYGPSYYGWRRGWR
jgi:hypothetical protein